MRAGDLSRQPSLAWGRVEVPVEAEAPGLVTCQAVDPQSPEHPCSLPAGAVCTEHHRGPSPPESSGPEPPGAPGQGWGRPRPDTQGLACPPCRVRTSIGCEGLALRRGPSPTPGAAAAARGQSRVCVLQPAPLLSAPRVLLTRGLCAVSLLASPWAGRVLGCHGREAGGGCGLEPGGPACECRLRSVCLQRSRLLSLYLWTCVRSGTPSQHSENPCCPRSCQKEQDHEGK